MRSIIFYCIVCVLQNKTSLTKILQEAHLKALIESECIDEDFQQNLFIDNENFDMIEPKIEGGQSVRLKLLKNNISLTVLLINFSIIKVHFIHYRSGFYNI